MCMHDSEVTYDIWAVHAVNAIFTLTLNLALTRKIPANYCPSDA